MVGARGFEPPTSRVRRFQTSDWLTMSLLRMTVPWAGVPVSRIGDGSSRISSRRGSVYYARIDVPTNPVQIVGTQTMKKSLGTKNATRRGMNADQP
ncbi:DUF6538 domain-containing protein [Paracoccus luteus]|uniref:DUF6538 domain-containing protein n=1 Tax=Paracoccus luteus TaxID=2508543 RepID=UPI003CCC4E5B